MKPIVILSVGIWANIPIALYAYSIAHNYVVFWQIMTRLTGRVSLVVFVGIMVFETCLLTKRALPTLLQKTTITQWATGFALHHYFHLLCIFLYVQSANIQLIPMRLAGGALAYVLIAVLPMLYAKDGQARWKRPLRFLYLYWVWFVLLMTYVARLRGDFPNAGGEQTEYIVFTSILICALATHFYMLLRKPTKAS